VFGVCSVLEHARRDLPSAEAESDRRAERDRPDQGSNSAGVHGKKQITVLEIDVTRGRFVSSGPS